MISVVGDTEALHFSDHHANYFNGSGSEHHRCPMLSVKAAAAYVANFSPNFDWAVPTHAFCLNLSPSSVALDVCLGNFNQLKDLISFLLPFFTTIDLLLPC